jgi:peptidoglycan/xylan/chitin deacetylase (PgdA/CDA1 family)
LAKASNNGMIKICFTFVLLYSNLKKLSIHWKNIFIVIALIHFIASQGISKDRKEASARIATWYGNKPAAVSVSFDDAGYSQYEFARPILDKYNIKGTFSIVGEWVQDQASYFAEPGHFEIERMGWTQLEELYSDGHELSAHGYFHSKYDKYKPVDEMAGEMKKIKDLIESKVPCKVFTIHYPYSYASGNIPLSAREAGFLFGRTGLDTINSPDPADMFLLSSMAILNSQTPGEDDFAQWITQAQGNWLILMYHHFFAGDSKELALFQVHNVVNTYSILPELFDRQMACLAASGYWIAPVCEIGKYITQRENTEVRIHTSGKKIIIYTFTNLDKTVYDSPLTLEVHIPWKAAKVTGSLEDGVKKAEDGIIYVNVLPETDVVITKI